MHFVLFQCVSLFVCRIKPWIKSTGAVACSQGRLGLVWFGLVCVLPLHFLGG
ncbi:hypothetical protein Hanom_Chr08g00704291 [Helianthus anomalus]